MERYYSQNEGFCLEGINVIPADVVEITLAEHTRLLNEQASGKIIQPDENGHPIAVEPPPRPEPTEAELAQQRIAEIQELLIANDLASVRPLRAKAAGRATAVDKARLVELEDQAEILRTELATLVEPESTEEEIQPLQRSSTLSFLKNCQWLKRQKS